MLDWSCPAVLALGFIRISTLSHFVLPHLQTPEPLVQSNQKCRKGQWGRWRCKWVPEDGRRRGEIGFSYTTLNEDLSHALCQRADPLLRARRGAVDVCESSKGMGQQVFPAGGYPGSIPHTPAQRLAAGLPPLLCAAQPPPSSPSALHSSPDWPWETTGGAV